MAKSIKNINNKKTVSEQTLHHEIEDQLVDSVHVIHDFLAQEKLKDQPDNVKKLAEKLDEVISLERLLKKTIQEYVVKIHESEKKILLEKHNNNIGEMKKHIRRNMNSIHRIEDGVSKKADRGLIEKILLYLMIFPGIPCSIGAIWLGKLSLFQSMWVLLPMFTLMVILLVSCWRIDKKIQKKKSESRALDLSDKHLRKAIEDRKKIVEKEIVSKEAKLRKNIDSWIEKELVKLKKE